MDIGGLFKAKSQLQGAAGLAAYHNITAKSILRLAHRVVARLASDRVACTLTSPIFFKGKKELGEVSIDRAAHLAALG